MNYKNPIPFYSRKYKRFFKTYNEFLSFAKVEIGRRLKAKTIKKVGAYTDKSGKQRFYVPMYKIKGKVGFHRATTFNQRRYNPEEYKKTWDDPRMMSKLDYSNELERVKKKHNLRF